MTNQGILRFYTLLFTSALVACSQSVDFTLVGDEEIRKIERSDISGEIDPASFATSIESINSRSSDGFFAYYVKSEDKVFEIIDRKEMHRLFYEIVECENPDIEIYSDQAYHLRKPPIGLTSTPSSEYFAVYIPKNYPEKFKLLKKSSGQEFKLNYNDLTAQCLRLTAGAMTGSNLESNLISLDGR